jgi:hypothetical protein
MRAHEPVRAASVRGGVNAGKITLLRNLFPSLAALFSAQRPVARGATSQILFIYVFTYVFVLPNRIY